MNDFLVSVCMITYNHESYVEEALNSILNQKVNFNVEVVIFDDQSKDGTQDILEKYKINSSKNFFFKIHYNQQRVGVAKNFKQALEACNGKYVALCEGDDAWGDEGKLKNQIDFLESNIGYIASFHDSHFYNERSELVYGSVLKNNSKRKLVFKDFLSGNHTIPTQSVVFRKKFKLLPKEFELIPNPDIFLFTYLSRDGDFYFQSKVKYSFYRLHSGGYFSTQSRFRQSLGNKITFKRMTVLFPDEKQLKESVLIKIFSCFIYALKEKNILLSIKLFMEYVFFQFFNPVVIKFKLKYPISVLRIYYTIK